MTAMSTLNNLADKIVNAMPKLGSGERRIAVGLYRLLAEGEPVSPERLAETLNLSGSTVRETLSRWPGRSEERRVGKEGRSRCGATAKQNKNKQDVHVLAE